VLNLLYININIDPNLGTIGPFQITWHGLFTALGIAASVVLAAYFARKRHVNEDYVYSIALWAVIGGIVGARLLYVIEHLSQFTHNLGSIFSVNEGGISIYGGLILGAVVGFLYAWRRHYPIRRISDTAALGMAVGQAVGRIGDFINGEHWAKASNLPWAFCYTNPNTLNGDPNTNTAAICGSISRQPLNPPAVHPVAGLYEPLALLLIFAVCWWLFRRLNVAGYIFWIYVAAYAVLRFGLSYLRTNEATAGPLTVPQVIAIPMFVIALIGLFVVYRISRRSPETSTAMQPDPAPPSPRAGRPQPRST
jgi:phosphatidylglycerol:prolipoprotein diacylglycerol transferase